MSKAFRLIAVMIFVGLLAPLLLVEAQEPKEVTITQILNKNRKDAHSSNVEESRKAFEEFYQYSRNLQHVVASLVVGLAHRDPEIRNKAAMALAQIGPSARLEARDRLVQMLEKEKESGLRVRVVMALGSIYFESVPADEYDTAAILALARALRTDPSGLVRSQVCVSLRNIGPGAKDAMGDLIDMMLRKDDDQTITDLARDAFGSVAGPGCKEHATRLLEVYRKGECDERTKFTLLIALGKIGAQEKEVVPLLVGVLKSKTPDSKRLRAAGAIGLGEMRAKAKDAVPALVEVLEESLRPDHDTSLNLRSSTVEALRKLGPHAVAAAPALRRIVDNPQLDKMVRRIAGRALKAIEAPNEK